jgi:metal-responsive CopG/Arc/MetJ family transcriptional regulator
LVSKKESPSFARVWILIPRVFLSHFDRAIEGMFSSRSEAIRRGMNLILDEINAFEEEASRGEDTPHSKPGEEARAREA